MITKNYFHCDHQHVFHRKRAFHFFNFFLSFFFFKLIYKGIIKNLLELFLYLRAFGKILTIFYNLKGHCQLNDCLITIASLGFIDLIFFFLIIVLKYCSTIYIHTI
jgi:hypothetical protein